MKACLVYMTCKDIEEAKKISRILLQKKLAACTNILGSMLSMYEWEGKLEEGEECVLIAKTRPEIFDSLKEEVLALHSYTCPCILLLPVLEGNPDFIKWISSQTKD